jgi:adenosylhomocysteine nucleosidase
LDADGLTFACATSSEAAVAKRLDLAHAVIGFRGAKGIPEGRLVSFGLAGALHDGVGLGDVIDAVRVVDADGTVLWEGAGLGARGARPGVVLAADGIVDSPAERRRLHEATGADVVDMESGVLARTGRLAGCLRAVSDTPSQGLGALASVGTVGWPRLAGAVGKRPVGTALAVVAAVRALKRLERAAA